MTQRYTVHLIIALLASMLSSVAGAEEWVYSVGSTTDRIYLVDLDSGAVQDLGPIHPDSSRYTTPIGVAVRPSDGAIFIANNSPSEDAGISRYYGPGILPEVVVPRAKIGSTISSIFFLPDDRLIASYGEVKEIDLDTGDVTLFIGHSAPDVYNPFDKSYYRFEYYFSDPVVERYDLAFNFLDRVFLPSPPNGEYYYALTISDDGQLILSTVGALYDFDMETGKLSNERSFPEWIWPQGFGGRLQYQPMLSQPELVPWSWGCNLNDSENYSLNGVRYLHETINIASTPGEKWVVSAINPGALYDDSASGISVGSNIPEVFPGVYGLDVWSQSGYTHEVAVNRVGSPLAAPLTVDVGGCTIADISIAQTDSNPNPILGEDHKYSFVVTNNGPNADPAVGLTEIFSDKLTCTFTSTASGGTTGNTPSGFGDLNEALNMPAGSSVTYNIDCAIESGVNNIITDVVDVTSSVIDSNAWNNRIYVTPSNRGIYLNPPECTNLDWSKGNVQFAPSTPAQGQEFFVCIAMPYFAVNGVFVGRQGNNIEILLEGLWSWLPGPVEYHGVRLGPLEEGNYSVDVRFDGRGVYMDQPLIVASAPARPIPTTGVWWWLMASAILVLIATNRMLLNSRGPAPK